MLRAAALFFLFFIFVAPILTLLHEIGHASMPMLRGQNVSVEVGKARIINFQIGKLTIELGFLKPWIGYTKWQYNQDVITLAAGPIFSLLLGATSLFFGIKLSTGETSAFLFACAGWCFFQFAFTIIPIEYPSWLGYEQGTTSDGLKIFRLLTTK